MIETEETQNSIKEFIICAAILLDETGKIYYGHRHQHCIEALDEELTWTMNRQEVAKVKTTQGFITNKNRFVDRKEALVIALANNQVDEKKVNKTNLYSEDLY